MRSTLRAVPANGDCPLFRGPAFTLVELMVVIAIIIILVGIGLTVGNSIVRSNEVNRTKATLANALQIATEYDVMLGTPGTPWAVNHLASRWPGSATKAGTTHHLDNREPREPAPTTDWALNKNYNSPTGAIGNGDELAGSTSGNKNQDRLPNAATNYAGDIAAKSIARFVWVTRRVNALEKLYATFHSAALKETVQGAAGQGYMGIVDAWGRPLIYAAFTREEIDYDNAIHDDDADDFLPRKPNGYFFASAGPDGKWGHADPDNANLVDYKVGAETPEQTRSRLREEAGDNVYSDETLTVQ